MPLLSPLQQKRQAILAGIRHDYQLASIDGFKAHEIIITNRVFERANFITGAINIKKCKNGIVTTQDNPELAQIAKLALYMAEDEFLSLPKTHPAVCLLNALSALYPPTQAAQPAKEEPITKTILPRHINKAPIIPPILITSHKDMDIKYLPACRNNYVRKRKILHWPNSTIEKLWDAFAKAKGDRFFEFRDTAIDMDEVKKIFCKGTKESVTDFLYTPNELLNIHRYRILKHFLTYCENATDRMHEYKKPVPAAKPKKKKSARPNPAA